MNQLAESMAPISGGKDVDRHWVIVTQVKSNRIVYFTDDSDYQPHMDGDWSYCSHYLGDLPAEMTLRNCWGWRFNGSVFSDARELPKKSTEEALIDANKKVLRKVLNEKIDQIRTPFLPNCEQGHVVRLRKLEQANLYIKKSDANGNFELLKYVAVARKISMLEAAKLIVAKAEETEKVLLESERFREHMDIAISNASSQDQLQELREWLLDKVYPLLTKQFRYRVEDTEPVDIDRIFSRAHRLHEIGRLKVQLREEINKLRTPLDSGYIQNDEIRKIKLHLAQSLIHSKADSIQHSSYELLSNYACARNLKPEDSAGLLINSKRIDDALLIRTEMIKDQILAKIDAVICLRDVREVERKIQDLCATDLAPRLIGGNDET